MDRVISELQRVKTEDGSYVVTLPVNTAMECYYDLATKTTVKMVLDKKMDADGGGITSKGINIKLNDVIKYHDVFVYNPGIHSSFTGRMKIKLPKLFSNTSISIKLNAFSYSEKSSWGITVNGFNATDGWKYASCEITGKAPFKYAYVSDDGVNSCIVLGEYDTEWKGIRIFIDEVIVSNEEVEGWDEGYEISYLTNSATLNVIEKCVNLGGSRIEIRKYHTDVKTEGVINVPFICEGSTIDEYNSEDDTLIVYVNGCKLTEDVHYTIKGTYIEGKDGMVFHGTNEEPMIFDFTLVKNSKPYE